MYRCVCVRMHLCLFVCTSDHVQTFELQFGLCKFARKCAFIAVHCGIIANYSRQHSMTGITFNERQQKATTTTALKCSEKNKVTQPASQINFNLYC